MILVLVLLLLMGLVSEYERAGPLLLGVLFVPVACTPTACSPAPPLLSTVGPQL